jgi:hypothetical protein
LSSSYLLGVVVKRWLLVAILSLATASTAAFGRYHFPVLPIPIYGTPPAHVARWMRVIWAGSTNHPIVPVYFMTDKRKATEGSFARYVVLDPSEYESLTRFTHSIQCSVERVSAKPPYPGSIGIQEYSRGEIRDLCVFPADGGCQYLSRISKLNGIDWSRKYNWPTSQFETELGCKEPLTEPHDADGRRQ